MKGLNIKNLILFVFVCILSATFSSSQARAHAGHGAEEQEALSKIYISITESFKQLASDKTLLRTMLFISDTEVILFRCGTRLFLLL